MECVGFTRMGRERHRLVVMVQTGLGDAAVVGHQGEHTTLHPRQQAGLRFRIRMQDVLWLATGTEQAGRCQASTQGRGNPDPRTFGLQFNDPGPVHFRPCAAASEA